MAEARPESGRDRHGPLAALLLVLTVVTGLVDAVSYFELGHVFVANMTGNVVFLGFAVADAKDFSIPASFAALLAFLLGALGGGRLAAARGQHRGRLLAAATCAETALVAAALAAVALLPSTPGALLQYALIVLLATAMGLQNATARRLGVPDLTTTVVTLTLAALASESSLAGGPAPSPRRRLYAVAAMFAGAALGALLLFRGAGVAGVLGTGLALLLGVAVVAHRLSASDAAWTRAA